MKQYFLGWFSGAIWSASYLVASLSVVNSVPVFAAELGPADIAQQDEARHARIHDQFKTSASFDASEGTSVEWLNAFETVVEEGAEPAPRLQNLLGLEAGGNWALASRLRLLRLFVQSGRPLPSTASSVEDQADLALTQGWIEPAAQIELVRLRDAVESARGLSGRSPWRALSVKAALLDRDTADRFARLGYGFTAPTSTLIQDLYTQMPLVDQYASGHYVGTPRLFIFCRHSRIYPCRAVIRDVHDEPLRDPSTHALWSQPTLSLSATGKAYDQVNGQTPQGVYSIDGVIQEGATVPFGRYPRLVINFVKTTSSGDGYKHLLPSSHAALDWWHQAWVAQQVGRTDFRMHGTERMNTNSSLSYYPFMPTSGCISSRENKYDGVTYKDQRLLLDAWLSALNLSSTSANERQIHGLLYLIEIDDHTGAVSRDDLAAYGIR